MCIMFIIIYIYEYVVCKYNVEYNNIIDIHYIIYSVYSIYNIIYYKQCI